MESVVEQEAERFFICLFISLFVDLFVSLKDRGPSVFCYKLSKLNLNRQYD